MTARTPAAARPRKRGGAAPRSVPTLSLAHALAAAVADAADEIVIGSACTGYGGLDIAVRAVLGGRVAWVADLDPGASKIIAYRFPGIPNLGDIRAVAWEDVTPVDVFCAGFPCQPVSAAGKKKGVADDRWIWDDLENALRRMARPPRALFLENVRGLLSANGGSAFARVLHGLARLGYVGRWRLVHAADVGAPHGRPRVFIWAWLPGTGPHAADAHSFGLDGPGASGWRPARHLAGADSPAAAYPGGEHGDHWRGTAPGQTPGGWPFGGAERRGGVDAGSGADHAGQVAAHAPGERRHERVPGPAWEQGRLDVALGGLPVAADAGRDPVRLESVAVAGRGGAAGPGHDQPGGGAEAAAHADGGDIEERDLGSPRSPGDDEHERPHAARRGVGAAGVGAAAADAQGAGPQGGRPADGQGPAERRGPEPGDQGPAGVGAAADADRCRRCGGQDAAGREPGGGTVDGGDRPRCGCGVDWGVYTDAVRRWEPIIGRAVPYPLMTGRRGGQVLAPVMPEWMMGLRAGWVSQVPGLSRVEQLTGTGNGVVPLQAAFGLYTLL